MKEELLFHPSDVRFFSSSAVVAESGRVADLVEEFGHCRPRCGKRRKQESAFESLSGIHLVGANRDYAS